MSLSSRSVYQNNGRPLSQQALYQQKLRQGIYNSPSAPSVGVNSNASDTAALLAASTDLTVRPSYERTVAPEAQDAALAAKLEKVYQWSREVDGLATSAAGNARAPSITSTSTTTTTNVGIPSLKGGAIYKAANKNSTSTMTSRINPDKDFRSGLKPNSSTPDFNIAALTQVANQKSSATLDSRFNPEYDYRSGLNKRDATITGKSQGTLTDSFSSKSRTKTFQASDISGSFLLSAASEKATNRLNSMGYTKPEDFKAQAQLYANALAVAQKRSDERIASHNTGVIDLGGGLTVTREELDRMASIIVQPVLSDISDKAQKQRDADVVAKKKQEELSQKHVQAKQKEADEKAAEKAALEKAKQERVVANDAEKSAKDDEYQLYQDGRNEEVAVKATELKTLEAEYAAKKEELLASKQENQDSIDVEEQGKINTRNEELDAMQAEKDEILQPTLDELKVETDKLNDLTDAKNELDTEVENLTTLNTEYNSKLEELNAKLKEAEEETAALTKELEETEAELDTTNKEVENLETEHSGVVADAEKEHKDLDEKLAELNKTKEDHLAKKSSQKDEIKAELEQRVKDEHAINSELPEHLRSDVNEKKLKDTSSLFSHEDVPEPVKPKAEPKVSKPLVDVKTKDPIKESRRKSYVSKFKSFLGGKEQKPVISKPVAKETKPVPKKAESVKEKPESIDYDGISIENKNKGGLFKEEI